MSAFSAAASDEDGDTISALRAAIEQARTWIAEHPDRRPISAGRMVAILTNALAAAPQPPAVEHDPVAEVGVIGWKNHLPNSGAVVHWTELMPSLGTKLYTSPQNLNCKSTQHRLATLWGYEKPQPPRQPLTEDGITQAFLTTGLFGPGDEVIGYEVEMVRAIERAHGIGGKK